MSNILRIILLCSSLTSWVSSAKLPSKFQRCHLNDKPCLLSAVDGALKYLKNGSPTLGIPTMDPLNIPSLTIGAGKGAVNVVQKYSDVKLYGYSTSTLKEFDIDMEKKKIHMEMLVPKLTMKSHYKINGRVLLLPVQGQGLNELQISNVTSTQDFTFDIIKKRNKDFIKIKDSFVTLNVTHANYYFEGLFGGNKELGAQILNVINENWRGVFEDVQEGYQNAYALIHKGFANQFFSRVPLERIFLDYKK